VRFEVLTAVKMSLLGFEVKLVVKMLMLVFWVVRLYGLAGRYQRFGETYCLHLQG
jgi:hypothetical protein